MVEPSSETCELNRWAEPILSFEKLELTALLVVPQIWCDCCGERSMSESSYSDVPGISHVEDNEADYIACYVVYPSTTGQLLRTLFIEDHIYSMEPE